MIAPRCFAMLTAKRSGFTTKTGSMPMPSSLLAPRSGNILTREPPSGPTCSGYVLALSAQPT